MSTQAFAEEPADEGAVQPTEGAKAAQPTPAVAAVAPVAAVAAPPARPAVAKPAVGDVSVHGYLRAGFGAGIVPKGRAVCFGLQSINGSLKSKYRLGNECELWAELMFSTVVYSGDDGVVGHFHFMPVAFIPTTEIGYNPAMTTSAQDQKGFTSTGATVAFPNAYADLQGIPWLFGGTAWAGSRYYKRESVYISDFFYWNPSGLGLGIEDAFRLGKISPSLPDMLKDVSFSYAAFAVDGQPSSNPYLPAKYALGIRNDFQIRGFRPWRGAEFQLGFQYIFDWSRDTNDAGDPAKTYGGWGGTLQYVQDVLGGNNKLAFQYGRGGGTGFGTLARFYYPDFSLNQDTSEWRLRVLDVLTIQPLDWLGAQVVAVYQHDTNGTPNAGDWYSFGGRLSFGILNNLKALVESGEDIVLPANNSGARKLLKATGAIAFASAKGFWARPELRIFYTWATWTDAARIAGVDSGGIFRDDPKYANYLSGSLFGVQAEAIW